MKLVLPAIAFVVLPILYFVLCRHLKHAGISRPPYIPYFFMFGSLAAGVLGVWVYPYEMETQICALISGLGVLLIYGCSFYLLFRPERTVYHKIALWGGFAYPLFHGFCLALISAI